MPLWWSEPTSSHAYVLSLVSIVITVIAAFIGIIGYARLKDSLILIYGLENIVDFFSSAIVLWRFNSKPSKSSVTDDIDEEQQRQHDDLLAKREKRASIGVSIVLAILGFGGLITAIDDLVRGKGADEDDVMVIYYISFVSFVVFGVLAKFKFHYANMLKSPSLRKDGICSGLGAVLSLSMFFNSLLTLASETQFWWWLDPTVAMFCGFGAFGYGIYGMYKAYVKDGYNIFSCSFWLYGAKSRTSNMNGQEIGGGGDLELHESQQPQQEQQQQNTDFPVKSVEAHPSSSGTQSEMPITQTTSNDMTDVVFT